MIIALVGVEWIQATFARRQTDWLISRRGDAFLTTLQGRLQERRSAEEGFAHMLSQHRDLVKAVREGDSKALSDLLGPLEAGMGLGHLAVFGKGGEVLLRLGSVTRLADQTPMVAGALAGWTQSAVVAVPGGLLVLSSAPVFGSGDTIGAVLIGSFLGAGALETFRTGDGEEVAVIQHGGLVMTTATDPGLISVLKGTTATPEGLAGLRGGLDALGMRAVIEPLSDGGYMAGLFPVDDILQTIDGMRDTPRLGILFLTGLLVLMGVHFAKTIAQPLDAMLMVTREIVSGNYRRRIPRSPILELSELAGAFNQMAHQVERQLHELAHQALHDPLTNLANRKMLIERLRKALARPGAPANSVAVIMLDLDNFKVINDSLGHLCGDELLYQCARRLEDVLPPEGLAIRQGGDEFSILLDGIGEMREATCVAAQVVAALREPFVVAGREIVITASVGIAYGTPGQHLPDDLLKAADLAAYRVKGTGKAGCAVYDHSMSALAMERLELESDLRRALERDELVLWYQPVVDLQSGHVVELEALIRWRHPARGLISPADFIPLAEETGLILPIGRWVLTQACRQACEWLAEFPEQPELVVGVNLSARQVHHPGVVEEVAQVLAETGLPPACLKLEITESVMMHDAEATVQTLRRLKALGLQLAVDDFGQGYSSLSYLKHFPLDVLKIDRAFVDKLGQDPQDTAIVEAIIRLARTLDLTVTGEGIETCGQVDILREMGCERGQGYYFARPQPSEAIAALLAGAPTGR